MQLCLKNLSEELYGADISSTVHSGLKTLMELVHCM